MTSITSHSQSILPVCSSDHIVVILGASKKPERYANLAQRDLMARGYQVIPVHPKLQKIEGIAVVNNLRSIARPVHTLTLYVGDSRLQELATDIVWLNPMRVIFNPGSESPALNELLQHHNISTVHGCTLVMLRTQQF